MKEFDIEGTMFDNKDGLDEWGLAPEQYDKIYDDDDEQERIELDILNEITVKTDDFIEEMISSPVVQTEEISTPKNIPKENKNYVDCDFPDEYELDEAIKQAWNDLADTEKKEGREYSYDEGNTFVHKRSSELLDKWKAERKAKE